MDSHLTRALLDDAVPALPPSSVDPLRAVQQGRAWRRRRAGLLCAAALTLAAVVAVPITLLPGRDPGVQTARSVQRFNPFIRTLRLGWTPPGIEPGSWSVAYMQQQFQARAATGGVLTVTVTLGSTPPPGWERETPQRPASPINGRRATCAARQGGSGTCSMLRWQLAPRVWGSVMYEDAHSNDGDALARRVAESVDLDGHEPVALPFRLTGRAATLPVIRTLVRPPAAGQGWYAGVTVSDDGAAETRAWDSVAGADLGLQPAPPGLEDPPGGTALPAMPHREQQTGFGFRRVGTSLVSTGVAQPTWSADALAADVAPVADPGDPATWVLWR